MAQGSGVLESGVLGFGVLGFGIDLGTTNCAIGVFNSDSSEIISLKIKQPVSSGLEQELLTLPSFLYIPPPTSGSNKGEKVAGVLAREKLGEQQGRVITSAKSWLAEPSIEPSRKILPWGSDVLEQSELVSPFEATAFYLGSLRNTIEERFGPSVFDTAKVAITIPASFNERASALTLEAAKLAGFPENTELIEEPQAAFYRYISTRRIPENTSTLLVCDIGGGTTDLSLFKVEWVQGRSDPELARVRVGQHLLLGGDNLDLGVAQLIKAEIESRGKSLSRAQWQKLLSLAQGIKEQALLAEGNNEIVISLPDAGRSLFKLTLTQKVKLEVVREYLLKEFFPSGALAEFPESNNPVVGALNYAKDQRFTAQVEKFLGSSLDNQKLDAVLFVGGTLVPQIFRERILSHIQSFQSHRPIELEQSQMELAVSLGAAEFIKRKNNKESRIRSGRARSLYLELGGATSELLCLLPLGFEAGERITLSPQSGALIVKVNSPVRFNLLASTNREKDKPGQTLEATSDILPVAPLKTMLNLTGSESRIAELPVEISVFVNELGRLQISLVNSERQREWKLQFDLLSESIADPRVEVAGRSPKEVLKPAAQLIEVVYGTGGTNSSPQLARGLFKSIENAIEINRKDWDPLLLRGLWSLLERGMTKKNRSMEHELTWLTLAGFTLRPGIGVELDEQRIDRLWKIFNLGLSFPKQKAIQTQWWTMWRRVAPGLDSSKQFRLFNLALPKGISKNEIKSLVSDPERLRLLSSLESIDSKTKCDLFDQLWALYKASPSELLAWSMSRLIARNLLSEKSDSLIAPHQAEEFLHEAFSLDLRIAKYSSLVGVIIRAAEFSNDALLCVNPDVRKIVIEKLQKLRIEASLYRSLIEYRPLGELSVNLLLGEELPPGLIFRKSEVSEKISNAA